jgi:hypothetical protein
MSGNEKYSLWLTIVLNHEYYGSDNFPAALVINAETSAKFQKLDFLFEELSPNKYIILIPENFDFDNLIKEEIYFRIGIKILDRQIYYVTDSINSSKFFRINDFSQKGIWKTLELNLNNIVTQQKKTIEIDISSVKKYYEYILIPKYTPKDAIIALSEEKKQITFSKSKIGIPGTLEVFQFISEEKVKLTQQNKIKTQLWEIRENGEKLISKEIPNPKPDSYSPIDPQNSITTYFYY